MVKKTTHHNTSSELKVTLLKSIHGRIKSHQDCVRGLGLKRINQTVKVKNNSCNLGMINKVSYLLAVEPA